MDEKRPRGWFIVGTDTSVGKTRFGVRLAAALTERGDRVGVYKPVETGWGDDPRTTDAFQLWRAAGESGSLDRVCPQHFAAPLAPYLAARQEGRTVDERLLISGMSVYSDAVDWLLVEGAGGLCSPITPTLLVIDLAVRLKLPLLLVAPDRLGAMNQVLMALAAAELHAPDLPIAGVVLSQPHPRDPADSETHVDFLTRKIGARMLGVLPYEAASLAPEIVDRLVG